MNHNAKKYTILLVVLFWVISLAVAQKFKWATTSPLTNCLTNIVTSVNGPIIVDVKTNNTIQTGWVAIGSTSVIKVAESVNITPRGSSGIIFPIYALSPNGALIWSNYLEASSGSLSLTYNGMEIDSDNRTLHMVGTFSGTLYVGAEQRSRCVLGQNQC